MITRDEALARARTWAAEGRPDVPPEIGLHEFDLGWVAWPIPPAPTNPDPTVPPSATGTPHVVIDRETGEISRWSSLPAEVIAKQYATTRAAEHRFPPDVRRVLDDAGWFPGRDVSAAINQWEINDAEEISGLPFFAVARAALREFGGLTVAQYDRKGGLNGFPSSFFPTPAGACTDAARVFADEYDNPVFPIGNNEDGPSEIVMDEQGRVFFLHWADQFFVGTGIDNALIALIRSNQWPQASDRTW